MAYPPVPFERCYWVVPGKLLAGYYPGDLDPGEAQKKLQGLLRAGIRQIINLTEEDECNMYGDGFIQYREEIEGYARSMRCEVVCVRKPIVDLGIPTREEMTAILDEIDSAIAAGRPVYVHCLGGKGRTGTVVGCYLARHAFASGDSALDMISRLRADYPDAKTPSPESLGQCDMVRSWNEGE